MTRSNASSDNESDSEIDSSRFDDWVKLATNWEASDRLVKTNPEEWVYTIDRLPPNNRELTAPTELEQHQQFTEQLDGSKRSELTEGNN